MVCTILQKNEIRSIGSHWSDQNKGGDIPVGVTYVAVGNKQDLSIPHDSRSIFPVFSLFWSISQLSLFGQNSLPPKKNNT